MIFEPAQISGYTLIPFQVYEEVKDFESLQNTVEEYLGEFNGESKQPMHLVMFGDAIDHVSRISRVIRYAAYYRLMFDGSALVQHFVTNSLKALFDSKSKTRWAFEAKSKLVRELSGHCRAHGPSLRDQPSLQ